MLVAVGTRRDAGPTPEGTAEAAGIPVAQCGRDIMYGSLRLAEPIARRPATATINQFGVGDALVV